MQQHGDTVAGRKIELIIRDDAGIADNARRIVQEMIVNDKVDIVGVGITPAALAIAQLVTEAKKATLVMSSGASITTTKSPYFVRVGFIIAPQAWTWPNGRSRTAASASSRWSTTGRRAPKRRPAFKTRFTQVGGEVIEFAPRAARQSRFRAAAAAHRRPQARHRLHLFPGSAGAGLHPAIRRRRASASPASRLSARATCATTTASTMPATR